MAFDPCHPRPGESSRVLRPGQPEQTLTPFVIARTHQKKARMPVALRAQRPGRFDAAGSEQRLLARCQQEKGQRL